MKTAVMEFALGQETLFSEIHKNNENAPSEINQLNVSLSI